MMASARNVFGIPVQQAPALAGLAAFAALAALCIDRVALPLLAKPMNHASLLALSRWGDFATNLAVIAGTIALAPALLAFVRRNGIVRPHRRILLAAFCGIFLPSVLATTVLERTRTSTEIVRFAFASALLISAIVGLSAARATPMRWGRVLGWCVTVMPIAILITEVWHMATERRIDVWILQAYELTRSLGEITYLATLALLVTLLLPVDGRLRTRIAHGVASMVLVTVLGGMYLAERALQRDYALVLYQAQHVSLLLDLWPRGYSAPIALVIAAAAAAVIGGASHQRQGAAAAMLLLASGYAPQTPARMLTLVLAMVLLARAIAARAELAILGSPRAQAPQGDSDAVAGAVDVRSGEGVGQS
jgi:hypothetical protein